MVNFITSVRRGWHGSLRTRDQVTFRNAEIGFEDGKGESLRQQNPVRDFVAFWCLSARESLTSGFDLPQLRIELRGPANSEVSSAQFCATYMTNLARGQQVVRTKLRRRVDTRAQYHCKKCYCGWNNPIHIHNNNNNFFRFMLSSSCINT